MVTLDGSDYLIDGCLGTFVALPLDPDAPTSTGDGIHEVKAVPTGDGFDIIFYQRHNRVDRLTFRTEPEFDRVDHGFFLARYDRTRRVGLFNDCLIACCRSPDSIVTVGRMNKFTVSPDNSLHKVQLDAVERKRVLIEELGLSEQIVETLPPDVEGGHALV